MSEVVIRGGTILTMDPDGAIERGDVASVDGCLVQVGGSYTPTRSDYEILDAEGCVVMPGLIQSHVHTCQTLARGRADEMELLDWLGKVVWPYEAALSREDVAVAARLACAELLLGGTTAILDMGTVHHTDAIFEVARDAGIRATIGKAMMDEDDPQIPRGLRESTDESLGESNRLCKEWHGRGDGRLRYAYAPRFALSCTDELLSQVAEVARERGVVIHTHASENKGELAEVERRKGCSNIEHLHRVGLTGSDACVAHCVWLSDEDADILATTKTQLLHCPSSNLKLASGVATIPELRARGVSSSLGADGAPCNNNLDGFWEMRLAGLIHKPRCGPKAMRAGDVVRMATTGGAEALGIGGETGSLVLGKRADVICVALEEAHIVPTEDPYSALVYAAKSTDVRHVVVDGRVVVRHKRLLTIDKDDVIPDARARARAVFARMESPSSRR